MLQTQDAKTMFLFPTPVILHDIEGAEKLNTELLAQITQRRSQDKGINRSNTGGWHSATDMTVWAEDSARKLLTEALALTTQHTTDVNPSGKREFSLNAQMWANVSGAGHSNQTHCHPGALWSGVYYVDAGEDLGVNGKNTDVEGELIITDPRFPVNVMYMPDLLLKDEAGNAQSPQFPIRPVNGRMVLFPAWLNHSVRPYKGTRERVSVAFNIMVRVDE